MQIARNKTRVVKIGNLGIGGNNHIAIQSMTKTRTCDVESTTRQIRQLASAGCEIVRLAVKDPADAKAFRAIKNKAPIPLVADIHFDWRLAILAIENGADKIRLNPGNIAKPEHVRAVVSALKAHKIPLRIGVNSGSVQGQPGKKLSTAERLVKSGLVYVRQIEKLKFHDLVISLKASTVLDTVQAYRKMSRLTDYPLHLGVTATGSPEKGAIKSSIAIGALLLQGIGDTFRVSLTDDPVHEVLVAKNILESLGLRNFGPQVISCPTCGRCEVDLIGIVARLEQQLSTFKSQPSTRPLKVAVMGCVVNGPGEAKDADIGVAFGKKDGVLFKKGKAMRKISYSSCVRTLLQEITKGK